MASATGARGAAKRARGDTKRKAGLAEIQRRDKEQEDRGRGVEVVDGKKEVDVGGAEDVEEKEGRGAEEGGCIDEEGSLPGRDFFAAGLLDELLERWFRLSPGARYTHLVEFITKLFLAFTRQHPEQLSGLLSPSYPPSQSKILLDNFNLFLVSCLLREVDRLQRQQ